MKKNLNGTIMMKSELKYFQEQHLGHLNKYLEVYLSRLNGEQTLKDAMFYSVSAGGKRIRPMLILAICNEAKRKIDEDVYAVAGSLELLHTYSLIHDDLPEMDNDDLRRGQLTNHKKFGQAIAVLAGDGLLTTAFECIGNTKLDDSVKAKLMTALAKAAGPQGMVSGQVADIEGEKKHLTLAQLQLLHQRKTGALIAYACYAGSLLGGVSTEQQKEIHQFAMAFGLAFQIYDDILDVVSTEKQLGKAVHKDQFEHKNTYPELMGLDGAYHQLNEALLKAQFSLKSLGQLGMKTELLSGFLDYFARRKNK